MQDLADSLNSQIGAIKRWREMLTKAKLLHLRQGADGLERYIVSRPGDEQRRAERTKERQRTQAINEQRAKEYAEALSNRDRDDESTRNLMQKVVEKRFRERKVTR